MKIIGASVKGPLHVKEGLPCQDAWLASSGPRSFAVVSDGMGSRPRSEIGSRAATYAVKDALRVWSWSAHASAEDLIKLIEVCWRVRIQDVPGEEAACTCLFYVEDGHGRALRGQLGDGIIVKLDDENKTSVLKPSSGDFGRTEALGVKHTLANWALEWTKPLKSGEAMLLATDGVSEDVLEDRWADLMVWIRDEVACQDWPNRKLARELRLWPVNNHLDDKTLAMMWRP